LTELVRSPSPQLQSEFNTNVDIEDARRRPKPRGNLDAVRIEFPESGGEQGLDSFLVSESTRLKNRAMVESLPVFWQFVVEMAPATVGTMFGSLAGLIGAVGGGFAGEAIGQELGISPKSNVGLAASAAGPLGGHLVGGTIKGVKKLAGATARFAPPSRVALARTMMRKAAHEFESIGTSILAKRKGLILANPETLAKIVAQATAKIDTTKIKATLDMFPALRKDLSRVKSRSEASKALQLLDEQEAILRSGNLTLEDLKFVKDVIEKGVGDASKAAGTRFTSRKAFVEAVTKDMDDLAVLNSKVGNIAKLSNAARDRFKLDFAIKDLEGGAADYIKWIEGKNITEMNVHGFRTWLKNATNPMSKSYNKTMTETLADDLPAIKESLRKLTQFGKGGSPGGAGSIVIRGKGAAAGAALFGSLGIPGGASFGAVLGAATPEMASAILMSPAAVGMLEKLAAAGGGVISARGWQTVGQIAAQGVKKVDDDARRREAQNTPLSGP
jgi:hypothetical protein